MFTINRNPSTKDLHWFAVGMIVGIPAVALLLLWKWPDRGGGVESAFRLAQMILIGIAVIGVAVGIAALASPTMGRKLYIGWMTVTIPIGIVMSTIMLSLLYVFLLPIFSLIVRRQDPLRKKLGGSTYWENYKPHEPTLERMRRPF